MAENHADTVYFYYIFVFGHRPKKNNSYNTVPAIRWVQSAAGPMTLDYSSCDTLVRIAHVHRTSYSSGCGKRAAHKNWPIWWVLPE